MGAGLAERPLRRRGALGRRGLLDPGRRRTERLRCRRLDRCLRRGLRCDLRRRCLRCDLLLDGSGFFLFFFVFLFFLVFFLGLLVFLFLFLLVVLDLTATRRVAALVVHDPVYFLLVVHLVLDRSDDALAVEVG